MDFARIQRWALTLSAYDYHIEFKPGLLNSNADILSRLPLPEEPAEVPLPGESILLMKNFQALPVTAAQLAKWTDRDPTQAKVRDNVLCDWQHSNEVNLLPCQRLKDELSVEVGWVVWGRRVKFHHKGEQKCWNWCMKDTQEPHG